MKIKVKIKVSDEDLTDILTTAFEGGINYWGETMNGPLDVIISIILNGRELIIYDVEDQDVNWALTRKKLKKGLQLFCKNRKIWDLDPANIDAEAAESIIQFALFGDLVFG